ncbi:MAG TPA: TraB/GumN family protein [Sphingomicrobium sp.]|jgi:uncharacterized protein YbaP (TraB family)|nr:TraB/GumN family protein [Sphingomicrobium sp.]
MLKKIMRRVLLALGLAAAAIAPQAAEAKATPALWSVSDADTTIYLFGTIHLLPEKYDWQSPKLEKAVAGSQELVVETIVDEKNPMQLVGLLMKLGISNDLPPIAQRVPPSKRAQLEAAIKKSGAPRAVFDRMETWAAAFMLLGNQFRDLGLKGDEGVETVLRSDFSSQNKPIDQLETNAEQLGFFDTLPEKAQQDLLLGAIQPKGAMQTDFKKMLVAWSKGDVTAIARAFNHDLQASPDLRDALIRRRNANWAKWIEQRMDKPGSILVAVGAGHLAGRYSVIDLLQRGGYKVTRLQ